MGLFDIFTKKEGTSGGEEQNVAPQAIVKTEPLTTEMPEQTSQAEQTILSTNAVVENPQPILNEQPGLKVDLNEVFEGGMTKEDAITQIVADQVNPSPSMVEIPPLASENPFQEEKTQEEMEQVPIEEQSISSLDNNLQQAIMPSITSEEMPIQQENSLLEIAPTVEGDNPFLEEPQVTALSNENVLPEISPVLENPVLPEEVKPVLEQSQVTDVKSETPFVQEQIQDIEIPVGKETNPIIEEVAPSLGSEGTSIEEQKQGIESVPMIEEDNLVKEESIVPNLSNEVPIEQNAVIKELPSIEVNGLQEEENTSIIIPEEAQDLSLLLNAQEDSPINSKEESLNQVENNALEEVVYPVIIEEEPQLVIVESTGEDVLKVSDAEDSVFPDEEENLEEQMQLAQDFITKEEKNVPIRFCDNCGEIITTDIAVCPNCGETID